MRFRFLLLTLLAVSTLTYRASAQEVDAESGLVIEAVKPPVNEEKKTEPAKSESSESPEESAAPKLMVRSVLLRAMNKITARSTTIEAQIGIIARFGNLEILARDCWKAPETERPENAALLDIWDRKQDEKPVRAYYGWMFSSSPSLSTLEHAVYDITVIECVAKPMSNDAAGE